MALTDLLEDFGNPVEIAVAAAPALDEAELESRRLAAFEEGYRAGWDDSDKNHAQSDGALSEALAQTLQDLSFTYQEAYTHMIGAVSPLLKDLVDGLLPELARQTLGTHIVETLEKHATEIGSVEVQIAVSPEQVEAVEAQTSGAFAFPVSVIADGALAAEQADIRFGTNEKQIDFADVIASMGEAVQGFAHDTMRTLSNG